MTELMRLVERLRNPAWVIPALGDPNRVVAYLDPVATRNDMHEAANKIEELERRLNDVIETLEQTGVRQ